MYILSRLAVDSPEYRVAYIHGYPHPQRWAIIGYDVLICRAPKTSWELAKQVLAEQQNLLGLDPDVTERQLQMLAELSARRMIEVWTRARRFNPPHGRDVQICCPSTTQPAASETASPPPTPGDPVRKPGRPTQSGTKLIAAEVRRRLARDEAIPTVAGMRNWLSGRHPDVIIPRYEAIRSAIRRRRDQHSK